ECVDTGSDPGHCGACGTLCGDEEVCSLGECSAGCASGLDACEGACVDLQSDRSHCGACLAECGDEQRCTSGACEDLVMDAGPRDAGGTPGGDAGPGRDAGRAMDGGGTGSGEDDGGCGCRVAGRREQSPVAWIVLALGGLLVGWAVRRRRSGRGATSRRVSLSPDGERVGVRGGRPTESG
ncbi:MAG: hypothetical protein IT379_12915, partial [Deltaproteobacteria bacterium]|nr:hypothetical protein [Deltaproteobacteria bacterium]